MLILPRREHLERESDDNAPSLPWNAAVVESLQARLGVPHRRTRQMSGPALWCPSCAAEYVAGSLYCSDCRVELVREPPDVPRGNRADEDGDWDDGGGSLVEVGTWPKLSAQVMRRRLDTAGIPVLADWTGPGPDAQGTLLVPEEHAEFAQAIVNELDVEDEVPDTSPEAYLARIDEHLYAVGALLDELRTRLEELETKDG